MINDDDDDFSISISFSRYPRLYHLNDQTTPNSYDHHESQWLGIQIHLNATDYFPFGTQYNWVISSNSPTDPEYHNGVDFWVINEMQLAGKSISSLRMLFPSLSHK